MTDSDGGKGLKFQIMDSILEHLKTRFDDVPVDYIPDDPETYRLNADAGALLLNYGRGKYGEHEDIGDVATTKNITFTLTIVSRELHGQGELGRHDSAISLLERSALALQGYNAAQTTKKIRLEQDYFIRYHRGLFYYGLDFSTQTMQVQDCFPAA